MFNQLQPLLVAAAIIREKLDDDLGSTKFDPLRVLIAKRKSDAKMEAGKWEFPGGKVEVGEHPEECLIREIREELGLEIDVDQFFALNSHIDESRGKLRHIVLLSYICWHVSGEVQLLDVADAKWATMDELSEYEWAEADLPFVEKLQKQGLPQVGFEHGE